MPSGSRHSRLAAVSYSAGMKCLQGFAWPLLAALGLGSMGTALALPAPAGFIVQMRDDGASGPAAGALPRLLTERPGSWAAARALGGRWHAVQPAAALDNAAAQALEARLRADPRVRAVVPDVREQRQDVTPNDARFGAQWWLQAVAAGNTGAAGFAKAWERSTGVANGGAANGAVANGAVVAVLDSGITSHIETNARVLPGYDFVADPVYAGDGNGRDNDPSDPGDAITADDRLRYPAQFSGCPDALRSSWHGSTIAGQLAAVSNNTEGVAAGNWQGLVLPVRVAGKCGAAVSDIIDGLRWAAGLAVTGVPANPNPARLIVLSYGGVDPCDINSANSAVRDTARLYEAALAEVRAAGAVVFVAAGNQRGAVGRPGSCQGAFAATSVNREGYKASYANFGASVALATPGGDAGSGGLCESGAADLRDSGIVSTGNLGDTTPGAAGYVAASGTSFAAPAVAAVASLMLAVNPQLTLLQIEQGLRASARPHLAVPLLGSCAADNPGRCACTAATCGSGLLDADQALAYALAPASYQAPARPTQTLADDRLRACATALGRPVEVSPPVPPAASAPQPAPAGGGGALSPAWLLGLALAVAGLGCTARPGRRWR